MSPMSEPEASLRAAAPPATGEAGARTWLWNKDLAAVPKERRTWDTYNYAALWVAMSVNIPTYMLASGMIAGGMNWKQAIFTVFLGNLIVLVPMLLNAHAGARYGIPFPVFARSSFGVLGANVPAMLRALVACGWFGIQTWIGGEAINAMLGAVIPDWNHPWSCFFLFWLLNLAVILRGIDTIRFLQGVSAPALLVLGLAMLAWAGSKAGGFGPMLSAPSKFKTFSEFFRFFVPSLTSVVAFWATVALNIPDFTRYAKGQREQMLGQALGLPTTMTLYSFIGVAVTSATVVIFGQAVWDPVVVLSRLGHPVAVVIAMVALLVATLNVNVAANVVSPANDFSNLYPRRISFKMGGVITCLVGLAMQPWRLLANYGSYIIGWLVGYSSFLGPIAGVLIADYYVVRKTVLLPDDLYRRQGFYEFSRGFHWEAVWALGAGIVVALAGLAVAPLAAPGHPAALRAVAGFVAQFYHYAWFVGFGVAFLLYLLLMRRRQDRKRAAAG
jgi:NCS1 family nucleobase:cation symporter-1